MGKGWYAGSLWEETAGFRRLYDAPRPRLEPVPYSEHEQCVVERVKRERFLDAMHAEFTKLQAKNRARFREYMLAVERDRALALLSSAGLHASADELAAKLEPEFEHG